MLALLQAGSHQRGEARAGRIAIRTRHQMVDDSGGCVQHRLDEAQTLGREPGPP